MPFKKGQSGNPGGKRKEKQFHEALQIALKEISGDDQRGLRKIAMALIEQAESGEPWAIKEVADRLDGRPAQTIDQNINDVGPDNSERHARISELLDRGRAGRASRTAGAGTGTNGAGKPH